MNDPATAQASAKEPVAENSPVQPADNSNVSQSEAGNVDKIREILFGGQMRDYDRRFARLEERLLKESNDLRESTRQSVAALEAFVKQEFQSLSSRLQAEQKNREGSIESVTRELHDTAKTLDTKLNQFDTQTTQTQSELRHQLLEQSKSLSEEIRRKTDEVSALVDREVKDLNHGKTDRASLSALFTEVALRLNNDFKIPGQD
jgi:seryl-tRNA synthetase